MNFKRQRKDEVDVNLTPLIDVVFLLLIFFMVSTTFTRETRLSVVLPEANGVAQLEAADAVEISIAASGDYAVNGDRLSRSDESTLRTVLLPLAQQSTDVPFVITADAQATHQAVVMVMDVAGQLGFVNLSITTQEPGAK
ncbi:MAG: biopolymer transporter ExbD [Gammaproteobacteria bacterium]|nr:biopolymer transporter ExbD [Gammaproteobacteria bacterium]MBQ0773695.1 biopolymer transporter ExbD [Gammaproteobacteria bacterium]